MTADTSIGKLQGKKVSQKVIRFAGIPYAKPPVGALRFKPPVKPDFRDGVRNAAEFGPASIQPMDEEEPASLGPQSEDCLLLNIWTQGADEKKRPVMVWIHGGGYFTGGISDPSYDGTALADRGDVVFVSIQYRLGALGWLFLDNTGGEDYRNSKNNGLLDQIAALKWIKENIAGFGGNPDNITIFGESAGSSSVTTLMVTPAARGLFSKVVAQSGTFDYSRTQERAGYYSQAFMRATNINDLQDLLELNEDEIRQGMTLISDAADFMSDWMFGPVFDGSLLPEDPYAYIAEGNTKNILLLHGSTKDEYRYWLNYFPQKMKTAPRKSMEALYKDGFGLDDDQISAFYQALTSYYPLKSESDKYIDIATWGFFRYPHARLSSAQSQHSRTWEYLFEWKSPVAPELGSYHSIELPFIFHTEDAPAFEGKAPTLLLDQIQDAWISFAKTGDPNHSGLPLWRPFNNKERPVMVFDSVPQLKNDPDGALRKKWPMV